MSEEPQSRGWPWKIYLGLLVGTMLAAIAGTLYFSTENETPLEWYVEWAAYPFYIVQIAGVYGFIYWKRFGDVRLWQAVFALTVLELAWNCYEMADWLREFPEGFEFLGGFTPYFLAGGALMLAVLVVPMLVALYVYAFRSPLLWTKPS
jgi:hypothetical protein